MQRPWSIAALLASSACLLIPHKTTIPRVPPPSVSWNISHQSLFKFLYRVAHWGYIILIWRSLFQNDSNLYKINIKSASTDAFDEENLSLFFLLPSW